MPSLRFLSEPRSPVDLAVTRIVVFGLLAYLSVQQHPVWMAGLPKDLLAPPPLTGWLTALPIDQGPVRAAQVVTIGCALAAMLGLGYRVTAPLAVLGSLYVLGVPQLWGKVDHYHNVVWFAAVLAVSPATAALVPGQPNQTAPSVAYGRPLAFMGLLIGLAYFWPGVAKLSAGPAWWWSDNLAYVLRQKWAELPGFTPLLRLDRVPLLTRLAAVGVVTFELSFVWLILFRRTRPFAVAGGLLFHALCAAMLGINFWPLWACYVVFLRWGSPIAEPVRVPERPAVAILGVALVTLGALAYPLGLDSWPVAYYPTFSGIAPRTVSADPSGIDPAIERRMTERMEGSRWSAILARARTDARTRRGLDSLLAR